MIPAISPAWGRHVNEADVAWPPEPWRILRALIAAYWRKGACVHWSKEDAASLIDALAAAPPIFHLPDGAAIVIAWPDLKLEPEQFALAADLAGGIGYLGRAESWVECTAATEWDVAEANCLPLDDSGAESGEVSGVLAPLTASGYAARRARLLAQADAEERSTAQTAGKRAPTERLLIRKRGRTFGVTLPERLMDGIAVDTADHHKHGWNLPPAAREIRYRRTPLSPHPRRAAARPHHRPARRRYTVARYLLAGRHRAPATPPHLPPPPLHSFCTAGVGQKPTGVLAHFPPGARTQKLWPPDGGHRVCRPLGVGE